MPRRPSPLPPGLPTRAFTAARAAALGMSPARLRGADIEYIGRGIYRLAGTATTELDVVAALLADRPEAVASDLTAARTWGFPLPRELGAAQWRLEHTIHATGPPRGRHAERGGVQWHARRLLPEHRTMVRGVPITTRERTFCDLARELTVADLVGVGDHLVRMPRPRYEGRTRPWSTVDRLVECARSMAGHRGAAVLRMALARVRVGADSPQETALRLMLEDAGLPRAQLNMPIIGPDGEHLHEPDLQWPRWRVAAEYEGAHHRTPEQLARDIRRAETMRRIGWTEVRIVAQDMRRGAADAVRRVGGALREHGWGG